MRRKSFWKIPVLWTLPAVVLFFLFLLAGIVAGLEFLPAENRTVAMGGSEINMETLEQLFAQVQKIEGMESEQKELARDLEILKNEIKEIEKSMSDEQIIYSRQKENLNQFLKTYQRMGPGSYLEIILQAEDLADFLRRLNILRDLTKNTGQLLDQIQVSREKQAAETSELAEKFSTIEDKQQKLKDALANEIQYKADLEKQLAGLAGDKENYLASLREMKEKWNELKPFFAATVKEFSRVLEEGNIPAGALKLNASFFSITGTLSEESINEIVARDPRLPQMTFSFYPGEARIGIPEKHLIVKGVFVIQDGHTLKFKPRSGSFYNLPLEESSLKELFREEDLGIECRSVLGGYALQSVEIRDGYLRFTIIP